MPYLAEKKSSAVMRPSDLELSVFRTVAYFDYFRYPLTSFEIWKWLLTPEKPYTFAEVFGALADSSWLAEHLERQNGFYALENIESMIADRRTRLADALTKYAKLKWIAQVIGRTPYINGVAVCNSLALHHTLPASDIDLFIIAEPGRIWSARLFSALPLFFLRQRPGERKEHPICLSFFVTPEAFDFTRIKIGEQDPYLAYWCDSLIPIVDRTGWRRTFQEQNLWVKSVLPQAYGVKRARIFRPSIKCRWPFGVIGEALSMRMQEERFPPSINELKNRDTKVVVTGNMLKFHEHDRREEIKNALEARMQAVV